MNDRDGFRPAVLSIEGLSVEFPGRNGPVRAVDGVSLTVHEREIVGLVGVSGSGKSVTCLAALGLTAGGAGRIASGRVMF